MRDDLKTLLRLQGLDLKIKSLKAEKEDIRCSIIKLKDKIAGEEADLNRLRDENKKELVKIKERELEVQEKRDQIAKYEKQLYQIKSNKEYQALLEEIKGLKADIGVIEDGTLELMEELEKTNEALRAEEEELGRDRAKIHLREEEASGVISRIDEEISRLSSEREVLIPRVGEDLFDKYCRILSHKTGRAIVPVVNLVCQGCDMKLTPQVNNDLLKEENILYCENCGRLIYLAEE